MKKQIIILILILICLAIVVGAGTYYFGKKSVVKKSNPAAQTNTNQAASKPVNIIKVPECDNLTNQADKLKCRQPRVIEQAAKSGDLDECAAVADKALANDCSAQVSFSLAIQKRDKKYCDNILNQTDKESCLKVLVGMGIK